jgi:hypothetical protein
MVLAPSRVSHVLAMSLVEVSEVERALLAGLGRLGGTVGVLLAVHHLFGRLFNSYSWLPLKRIISEAVSRIL